jgi:hypothetical protein
MAHVADANYADNTGERSDVGMCLGQGQRRCAVFGPWCSREHARGEWH